MANSKQYRINNEMSINIKRLLVSVLRQWRIILAAMAVGAVLLAAFAMLRPQQMTQPDPALITQNQQLIDSNNAAINECRTTISNNDSQIASVDSYVSARERAIESLNVTLAEQQSYLAAYEDMLREANRLRGTVPAASRAELMAQITELTEKIPAMKTQISSTQTSINTYNNEINNMKHAVENTLPASTTACNERIAELEQQNEQLRAAITPQPIPKTVGSAVKFAVIGMILGAFAVAAFILARIIFSPKTACEAAVRERYGLPVLSDMHVSSAKHSTAIDLMLDKWNGDPRQINAEEEHCLLAAKLRAVCPGDADTVLLCGTVGQDVLSSLCSGLEKHLDGALRLQVIADPVSSAESALAARGATVLLVEKSDCSLLPDIDRTVELLALSGADILGCALV